MTIHPFRFLLTLSAFFFTTCLFGQTVIWLEDFSGAPPAPGWNDNFVDCDGTPESFSGVQNGRFEVTDMEGDPCCPAGMAVGGGNNNDWTTNDIDIAGFCDVTISVGYGSNGTFECSAGGPYFGCTGDPFIENGHDQMIFEYSLDGGAFVEFFYLCGGGSGTATINGLSGTSIRVRIRPANKAVGETYWFDNVQITGVQPTVNPIADVEGCAGSNIPVVFSGMGNPAPTFSWTNDNTAIGLMASGNGNLNFTPPVGLSNEETATITVTPMAAGCSGPSESFMITVYPLPLTDDPADVIACAGDFVEVIFTGNDPNAVYNWTVNNIPLFPPSGQGDLSGTVPPIPFSVNGTVTVSAESNGCPGPSQTFNVTLNPAISATFTMTSPANLCNGQPAAFTVNFSGGNAPYSFTYAIDGAQQPPLMTNNDPFNFTIPLSASANISAIGITNGNGCVADVTGDFDVTVTPAPTAMLAAGPTAICAGESVDLQVLFNGSDDYTFGYTANGIPQPAVTATGPDYTLNVTPAGNSVTYTLTTVNSNGCTGTASGSHVVNTTPTPTAFINGAPVVCSGQNVSIQVAFSGTAPWTFVYSIDGNEEPPITTSNTPYIISGTYNATTTLELVSVATGNCLGTTSGIAVVTVLPGVTGVLTSGNTAVCAGQNDTLEFTFTGTGPYTFIYTENGVAQAAITTSQTTYLIPITPSATTTYVLTSVTSSSCPNGNASGTYTVGVATPPTATLTSADTLCGDTPVLINFTGDAPWTFAYSGNGVPVDTITTSTNPYQLIVNPDTITIYKLTFVTSGSCGGTVSTDSVLMYPNPTVVLTGGGQICQNGTGTDLVFTFTGTAPWTVNYTANGNPMTATSATSPLIVPVNPSTGTIYNLVQVSDAFCTDTAVGQVIVFVFTPANAQLMGSNVFCDSANTNITVEFTGTGPFIINYTINGVAQLPDTTFDDPYIIPVNVTTTTTYQLTSIESPGCDGIISGPPAVITVNYAPTYANLNLVCNPALGTYVVTFDVLGATLPLTSTGGNTGTFTGTQWTSDPIPQAMDYSFSFEDANGCGIVTVSGTSTCNCTTEAGTMNLSPINACENEIATAVYNGGFFNDGNDTLLYVLHQNPALPLGVIYGWNNSPSFGILPGMVLGTTYYISAIAGDISMAGLVDTSDICLKVAQGTPVIFHGAPVAVLSPALDTVCQGVPTTLTVNFMGTAPFAFTYSIDNVPQTPITGINVNPYTFMVTPSANMVVTLETVGDLYCGNIPNPDTSILTLIPPPVIGNVQAICDYTTNTYTVNFDIISGTPPFNVNGIAGFFSANSFSSIPIPFGSPDFFATFTDASNCGQDTIAGMAVCNCLADAGTMSQQPISVCGNLQMSVPAALNPVLGPNDVLMYIMHTNPGIPLGTIVGWSSTPDFTFMPPMQSGIQYYISSIVGIPDGNGMIDLQDLCLAVSMGTPVRWLATPTANLVQGNYNICPGGTQSLLVTLTGAPNFMLSYTNNGNPFTVSATNLNFLLNATLQQTATFILTGVSDANCAGTVTGSAVVTVHPVPLAGNFTSNCDLNTQTYTIEFDVTQGDLSTINVANTPGVYDPTTGHFTSDPIPNGQPYSVLVTDVWNCGNFSKTDSVNCICATNAGVMDNSPLNPCYGQTVNTSTANGTVLAPGDTLLYYLVSQATMPPLWTIITVSNTPTFVFNPATMVPGTTYFIVAVAGNIGGMNGVNLTDPCLSIVPGPTVIWRPEVTATLSGAPEICAGGMAMIEVQFTGDGPFDFGYTNGITPQALTGITQNPYQITVSPTVNTGYNLVNVTGAGNCPGTISGSAAVTISNAPQILNLTENCDLATETFTLTFHVGNGAQTNSTYTVTGIQGTFSDTTFTSIAYPGTTPYSITVTNALGCSSTLSGVGTCVCSTGSGTLTNAQNACLPSGTVSAQPSGNATLDANDVLNYVLCSDPTQLPMSIIAQSATPTFPFQPGMTPGITYFIVAIAGNDMGGMVDLNDPCLASSPGVPVVFNFAPSALIVGDQTLCAGDNATFDVQLSGVAPFSFTYAINGVQQTPVSTPNSNFNILSSNVQQDQVFTLVSVMDANCPGTVDGQATLTVPPTPMGSISGVSNICAGDTTVLTLFLSGGSTFDVTIGGANPPIQLMGVQNGATISVAPSASTTYTITSLVSTGNSCPANLGPAFTVNAATVNANSVLSDFGGFNTSCPLSDDGTITLTPMGGNLPLNVAWSNGINTLNNTNLEAGTYTVTLTDQIGCSFTQMYTIVSPPELRMTFSTIPPTCFGDGDGSITITGVTGGVGPFAVSINGQANQSTNSFPIDIPRLESGLYDISLEDSNGCVSDTTADVPSPAELMVNLGPDTTILLGDSIVLNGIVNFADIDTFFWTPQDYLRTPDALSSITYPLNSTRYTLQVTSVAGCVVRDDIWVVVQKEKRVYIPNIIDPNANDLNNILTVYGGSDVRLVRTMQIYDRWGEMLFENRNFLPNDPQFGWSGAFKGEPVNPGVYVYVVEVEYVNGDTEVISGDITVVR